MEDRATEGWTNASLHERRSALRDTVAELYALGDERALRLILNSQFPADLADLMRHRTEDEQHYLFELLAEGVAAGVLAELDTPTMLEVAEGMGDHQLSELVGEMAPDDAADVLGELPEGQSEKVLELMEDEDAEEVRELLAHEEDTGGGIMTSRLLIVREDMRVEEAIRYLREWAEEEQILNIYVLDEGDALSGTLSLRSLLLAQPETLVRTIAERDPIAIGAHMDQEEIAHLFRDYDLLALPVVDGEGKLIGEVTIDDIVSVMEEEATEDMYVMAATSSEEREERSTLGVVRRRMPWLLICMLGTMVAGAMIHAFQERLADAAVLLLFVPAIMAMGGNTGIQTSTVTIRSLATGELRGTNVLKTIGREVRIALVMGALLGSAVLCIATAWTEMWTIGLCVGLAMCSAVVFSACMGALIPLVFRSMGIDPAVASGPLITTLNDGISLGIYFLVARAMLVTWG